MLEAKIRVGSRVEVVGKDAVGTVAFIGTTQFSTGKWIGVSLDEPKGKNDGTVQGKRYFTCPENHGLFVRSTQVKLLDGDGNVMETSISSAISESEDSKSGIPRNRSSASLGQTAKPTAGGGGTAKPPASTESLHTPQEATSASPLLSSDRPTTVTSGRKSGGTPVIKDPLSPATQGSPQKPAISVPTTEVSFVPPENERSPNTELELSNLRAEIKVMTEQLEALKVKREEDRVRLQEVERLKIQLTQLEENRRLMREQAAELQRELAQLKRERADVQQAFDNYKEEMSEMVESMEMATLDKEMAEEKCDTLTGELELLKEQVEELILENHILKEEAGGGAAAPGAGPTPQQLKTLEQQNERMKEALVKLRDLTNQDKQDITKLNKEIGKLESEVNQVTTERDRLSSELKQSLEQTIELKEQVDAALGADQMVAQLTQTSLELEEKLDRLTEERNDLEALCEMNDELQENSRDTERELREEIELARIQINQLVRHMDACRETIADNEHTINKFRDLVTELQAQNNDLRRLKADGECQQADVTQQHNLAPSSKPSVIPAGLNFISQAQTMSKVIEAELRRLEAEETAFHVNRLTAFLPDSFVRRGSDNDALLALLLINRLAAKSELLANHLTERYPLPACIPIPVKVTTVSIVEHSSSGDDTADLLKTGSGTTSLPPMTTSKAEFYSFITRLIHLLHSWTDILAHYKHVLSACNVDLYLKLGSLYMEMASHEQCLDRLIELTKKDQLDENISLEPLASSVHYFEQLRSVHLMSEPSLNCSDKLFQFTRCVLAATDALSTNCTALSILTGQPLEKLESTAEGAAASVFGPILVTQESKPTDDVKPAESKTNEGLFGLLLEILQFATVARITARRIRRRLPSNALKEPLSFDATVVGNLHWTLELLNSIVAILFETTSLAGQLAVRQGDDSAALKPNMVYSNCFVQACNEYMTRSGGDKLSPELFIHNCLCQTKNLIGNLATSMDNGEYDFDGTKQSKPQEPVMLRAAAFKQAQAELEGCRVRLESKDEEMRELQVVLKTRANELSEMSVRVSLAEKRLETAGKGSEEKIVRLTQRAEQLEVQQKRSDREHEQTIDALQADIDALERDKAELKEKLKSISKKTLMEDIIKVPTTAAKSHSPTTIPTSTPPPSRTRDAVFLVQENDSLKEAVRRLTEDNSRFRGERMLEQLKVLKPLRRPLRRRTPAMGGATEVVPENLGTPEVGHPLSEQGSVKQGTLTSATLQQLDELNKRIFEFMAHPRVVRLASTEDTVTDATLQGEIGTEGRNVLSSATSQLTRQTAYLIKLKNELEELKKRAMEAAKKDYPHAFIPADFTCFPSYRMQNLFSDSTLTGDHLMFRLKFPGLQMESNESSPTKLVLSSTQVRVLHSQILSS